MMFSASKGSMRLFRVLGITVFLHWSWFLVAAYQLEYRSGRYEAFGWALAEYLGLFLMVLLHEFGHALACRQTGGQAREILLWPLGGVAYVQPPPRPGAVLWSIAAGPLVNVALFPVLWAALQGGVAWGWFDAAPSAYALLNRLFWINVVLLVFNLLPIYPLDGGQILRALLWFKTGPVRSLGIASLVGMAGAAALVALALWAGDFFLGLIALFAASQAWGAFRLARRMAGGPA